MIDYINTPPEHFLKGGPLSDSKSEEIENFRATREFKDWLKEYSDSHKLCRSDYVREALCGWSTLIRIYPELRSIPLANLRKDKEHVRKILVLLEEV